MTLVARLIRGIWFFGLATWVLAEGETPIGTVDHDSRLNELREEIAIARESFAGLELTETARVQVDESLDQAEERLNMAEGMRSREDELSRLVPAAPARIEALEAELAAVGETVRSIPTEFLEVTEAAEQIRTEIARLETDLSAAQSALAELRERPVQIGTRLPEVMSRIGQIADSATAPLEDGTSTPRQAAALLRDRAALKALQAEADLLQKERDTQSLRERISALGIQLKERRLAAKREWLALLDERRSVLAEDEFTGLRRVLEDMAGEPAAPQEELEAMVDEMEGWIGELEQTVADSEGISRRSDSIREQLEMLRRDNERIRRQIALGGFEGAFTQLLIEQRQRLQSRRSLDYDLRQLDREITNAQLDGIRIDDLRRDLSPLRERWRGDPDGEPLIEFRSNLVERLDAAQREKIRQLTRLGSDQQAHRDLTVEFSVFLLDQLFWRRSSPPVDSGFFRGMASGVKSWFEMETLLWSTLKDLPAQRPGLVGMILVFFTALLAVRRRLRQTMEHSGRRIRRISSDRLGHTIRALVATLFLALPLPLFIWANATGLASAPTPDPWVRGSTRWLTWAAWMLLWIFALGSMVSKEGIGRQHFGWDPHACDAVRKGLRRLLFVYVPAMLVVSLTYYDRTPLAFDSLGRLAFITSQFGLIWALAAIFSPSGGAFTAITLDKPDGWLSRSKHVCFASVVGIPALMVILAIMGYTLTAFVLADRFMASLQWVAGGVIVYGLLTRWLMIKQRRIALSEAIELRRARREASAQEKIPGDEREAAAGEEDHVELDLGDVVHQTRHLARSLVGIAVVVGVTHGLMSGLPLEQAGENLGLLANFQWITGLRALLIVLVTVTVVKNLPGLLDVVGLRSSGMSPGSRYALSTLGQYALAATGVLILAGELELDWSRFGWIAAALSVGLGFGLQEIVANFVCGIILLFERPIRVGDVVTVGEVTGSVSQIRMRATTITNWDRQEFVVPNKEFITGSLINWTLSNKMNRFVIPVGVAYGTDTRKARQLMLDAARSHPHVLEDPEPVSVFNGFGDSTLDLELRCFLSSLECRVQTITELNEEIDRRFAQAGIEIAFPQRDLNLRTVPEGWSVPDPQRNGRA